MTEPRQGLGLVLGSNLQPVVASQVSSMQGRASLQTCFLPPAQTPDLQASPLVQTSPSLQGPPSFTALLLHLPCTQASTVQLLPSLQLALTAHGRASDTPRTRAMSSMNQPSPRFSAASAWKRTRIWIVLPAQLLRSISTLAQAPPVPQEATRVSMPGPKPLSDTST